MKILIVGGAVRDILLGRVPSDFDFLVNGCSVEEFLSIFNTAKLVGKDFPVFLVDGEEYAFARTERSTGDSHREFKTIVSPDITIEEDLIRRDLTINAMAMCAESGKVIASEQSIQDIQDKVLRHTSEAFKEDPLRVFRVARFACQLPDFSIAQETLDLMAKMKSMLNLLSPERVFKEMVKALETESTSRFFTTLLTCNCLDVFFPELQALVNVPAGPNLGKHYGEVDCFDHTMRVVDRTEGVPEQKFSSLCHDLGKALSESPPKHHGHDYTGLPLVEALCDRLKVPNSFRRSAMLFTEQHIRMHKILEMKPGKAVNLVLRADKTMTGGLRGFLNCSAGDGSTVCEVETILKCHEAVAQVKLPIELQNRGKACAEILMNLRTSAWKKAKGKYYGKINR